MNDEAVASLDELKSISKRLAKRALDMGENRLQLFLVEVEEERERLIQALLLALCAAAFALLAGVAFTITVLLLCWNWSPLVAVAALTLFYAALALFFTSRLGRLRRDWETFSASLSQLRKDSSCLGDILH